MTKTQKPITERDLVQLVEEIKHQFKTNGHADTFGIDHIQGAQDGKTGPRLTIIANDTKNYTWNVFQYGGMRLHEFLESKGWRKAGEIDGDLVDVYRNKEQEGELVGEPPNLGLQGQFITGLRLCHNATVVVVHDDLAYMARHMADGRGSLHTAALVWKLAQEFPHVMAMVRTHKREEQGVDFVFKYLYNAHGVMLGDRDMDKARKALAKAPARKKLKVANATA